MCPLPVYRNMIDMCIFILHPATLLSTHSGRFSCRFLGIFYLDNLLTFTNRHSFISSFLIPYLLLPFLIAVARTSNTVLNKSENGLSCSQFWRESIQGFGLYGVVYSRGSLIASQQMIAASVVRQPLALSDGCEKFCEKNQA